MQPIIQRKEEAELEELDPQLAKKLVAAEELEKEEHDRTRQFLLPRLFLLPHAFLILLEPLTSYSSSLYCLFL